MMPILIFDYDGTIHDTFRIYKPAIASVVEWLRAKGIPAAGMPGDARIRSWLGMSTPAMWEDFMPSLPADLKDQAGQLVGTVMREQIESGNAQWYLGAEEALDRLKQDGYRMLVLSSCDEAYAALNRKAFGMDRWFERFIAAASYGYRSKAEIVRILLEEMSEQDPQPAAVIGDRRYDCLAAEDNSLPFIGCLYGYGAADEFKGAGRILLCRSVSDLPDIVRRCGDIF